MKTQRGILLGIFVLCFIILVVGVILFIRLVSPSEDNNGLEPTLVALLTAHALNGGAVGEPQETSQPLLITPSTAETLQAVPPTPQDQVEDGRQVYKSMPGDTLDAILARFGANIEDIHWTGIYSARVFLPSGTEIDLPRPEFETGPSTLLIPDSAVVYGTHDAGFDVRQYVEAAGGYLSEYEGDARGEWMDGAAIVERVAQEHSISAKLLLAVLEYRSGWVFGNTEAMRGQIFPIGFHAVGADGLYEELYISARLLGYGYYGWRDGSRVTMQFPDGSNLRLHPALNAGSAGLENLFAGLEKRSLWEQQLFSEFAFMQTYQQMFGDVWANEKEPQIPDWLTQIPLDLPFQAGEDYFLTSGPHRAWGLGSPWAAIDFAPADGLKKCLVSPFWVTASASGIVVRAENGVVVIDTDNDGQEQTGWVLFYLHIAEKDRIAAGERIETGTKLGHASCEGGVATGSHIHFARKYNGEWMPAGGAIPLNLSGWIVENGKNEYLGQMVRDGRIVIAYPSSISTARISHD